MKQTQALEVLKAGKNVYLTGAAGSGKTHVLNKYISYIKERGIPIAVTASTGIAATHLGGVTLHSWSGVGVRDTLSQYELEALAQKEYLWKRFEKTKILVIDEVSMLSPRLFDTVERVCREMKRSDKPFGGMQIVLAGDFFQLPPITRGNMAVEFIHVSDAWKASDIRVCYLDEQFRHGDAVLENLLNEIRGGAVSSHTKKILMASGYKERKSGALPTRLYTHNADVDAENEIELGKLSGEEKTYEMRSKGKLHLVETLKKNILAPETLKLKKDAVVMFVKNNIEGGYNNGTLGTVTDFDDEQPVVRTFDGRDIAVSSAEWEIKEDEKTLASVSQLPLRLAWAITIHKSQGMSMDAAEIDLSQAFVPGQGYVALSRLRSLSGLFLRGMNDMALAVYPDVAVLDKRLLADSSKWERSLRQFSEKELEAMHEKFIIACGGTLNKKEIAKNREKHKKEKESPKQRVSTYEKTREYVARGLSLQAIAKERGMTPGTIISHLEKIKALFPDCDLIRFRPDARDFKKIKEAFAATKDMKLTPAHRKLKGEYSFDDLRLARLFL
ncbi:MAG: AAA family ATPase [Parcubacteria group bacterium]|nr:AAA family ATPase [Parcubacteria group bacterium]